jgi:hypothetical protein
VSHATLVLRYVVPETRSSCLVGNDLFNYCTCLDRPPGCNVCTYV